MRCCFGGLGVRVGVRVRLSTDEFSGDVEYMGELRCCCRFASGDVLVGVKGRGGGVGVGVAPSRLGLDGRLFAVDPGMRPEKKLTTEPTLSCLRGTGRLGSGDSCLTRSDSGVNTRVSLYPASRRRSSRRSYVCDVPRRCSGTRPRLSG